MVPTFPVEVIGSRGAIAVEAFVDTGFEGEVSIPVEAAIQLGVELIGRENIEYADGRISTELVFSGQVRFLDNVLPVRVFLTESAETLIGTELLADCALFVEFPTGRVEITRNEAT